VLLHLSLTGFYPVVVYLAYLCAGLAIGRLDLRSRLVAGWLLVSGIALAITARVVSWVLLHPFGGLDRLVAARDADESAAEAAATLLWEPDQGSSWWYLALSSPHAHTPLDMAHVIGSGMAVVGAAILLTGVPAVRRLLMPLEAAGSMTLTLYTAHVLVLESGLFEDWATAQYLLLVGGSLVFAVLWRRRHAQGPLEKLVATPSTRARQAVLARVAAPVTTGERRELVLR
jgi:uncharacterized membrane protein YeiB